MNLRDVVYRAGQKLMFAAGGEGICEACGARIPNNGGIRRWCPPPKPCRERAKAAMREAERQKKWFERAQRAYTPRDASHGVSIEEETDAQASGSVEQQIGRAEELDRGRDQAPRSPDAPGEVGGHVANEFRA